MNTIKILSNTIHYISESGRYTFSCRIKDISAITRQDNQIRIYLNGDSEPFVINLHHDIVENAYDEIFNRLEEEV